MTHKDEDPPDDSEIEIDEDDLESVERKAPRGPAPALDELPAGVPRRRRVTTRQLVWGLVPVSILLILGAIQVVVRRADQQRADERCAGQLGSSDTHLGRGDLDLAERALPNADEECAVAHSAQIAELRRRIAAARAGAKTKSDIDGVKYTRGGHVAAWSLEKMELAVRYAAKKDKVGFDHLIQNDDDFIVLKPQLPVNIIGRSGVTPPLVQIHVRGTPVDMWTTADALQDP